MRRIALASVLALACSRPATPSSVALRPQPAASAPAAAQGPAPIAPVVDVVGGDLVDLGAMKVVRTLVHGELVLSHALGGRAAYVWVRTPTKGDELRAFDAASGALLWSEPADECWRLAASTEAAFCPTHRGVERFLRRDGSRATTGSPTAVTDVVVLGSRVLAVHGGTFEALDATGSVAGSMPAPFDPDSGYGRHALGVAGGLACGVRRDDTGADVFCADATPRVVWRRRATVPGGVLVQADDVLVIHSDPWGKSPSSVVLRTSDGHELLNTAGRIAAAVAPGGRLERALSLDPPVTLLDAQGNKLGTWPAPAFPRDALRAVKVGSTLAVALYNPIATGTQLVGLDAASGALVWQAKVDSLPIAHSKYRNEVELHARGSVITLSGIESGQEYVQTFDAATGSRLASIVRGR